MRESGVAMMNLEIDDFNCHYIISKSNNSIASLRDRFDYISKNLLAKALERKISSTDEDTSLILINKLELDFSLSLSDLSDVDIADMWSSQLVSEFKKSMNSSDSSNVVIFSSRAEYLASFIADLIKGVAWQKWQYDGFEHLKKFDSRGVIKEVLKWDHEIVEDILLLLVEKNCLDELLRELKEDDFKIIYDDYLDAHEKYGSKSYRDLIRILTTVLDESSLDFHGKEFLSFKNYLRLYLKTIQRYPELRSVPFLRKAVRLTFLLKELLKKSTGGEVVSNLIEQGDMEGFLSFVQSETDRNSPGLFSFIKEVITSEGETAFFEIIKEIKEKSATVSAEKIITTYGGIFVLIRTILEMKLNLLINNSSYPEWDNLSRPQTLFLFLAQKIAGYKELIYEGIDSGLLAFAGFKNPPMPVLLKEYVEAITPEMNIHFLKTVKKSFPQDMEIIKADLPKKNEDVNFDDVLEITTKIIYHNFAKRLRRFEKSNAEYIYINFLQRPAEIALEQDGISIKLSKKPLDIILRMSGSIEEINGVSWLNNKSVRFVLGAV